MRLIDEDALMKNAIEDEYGVEHVLVSAIRDAPTIDAEPVRHGTWAFEPCADGLVRCDKCFFITGEDNNYNYCPNCGAKMDEKEE